MQNDPNTGLNTGNHGISDFDLSGKVYNCTASLYTQITYMAPHSVYKSFDGLLLSSQDSMLIAVYLFYPLYFV